jgi:acyl carrier protein phosphodiesterase
MNFLAHLFLADPTPDSLYGNLLADIVKGKAVASLPAGIQNGVRLHRQVDSFTDRSGVVQRSITRISQRWGWFSGILVDVYYDHILALNWAHYHDEPLRQFVDRVHQCLCDNIDLVPMPSREPLGRMIQSDRLFTYSTTEGIAEALRRLSDRIRERMPQRAVQLDQAMPDLEANHEALTLDFQEFFPQLIDFVRNWKRNPQLWADRLGRNEK